MTYVIVGGITVIETPQRVGDGKPALVTRFHFRAKRFARKRNEGVIFPSYRYEVIRWPDDPKDKIGTSRDRWAVVVMQNVAAG